MKIFVLTLSVIAAVQCGPVVQDDSVLKIVVTNFVNCMNSDLSLCLKEHALRATERFGNARQLKLIDGVNLITNAPKKARSLEPLSSELEERKRQVSERLWESTTDLLQNSELELSYGVAEDSESRAIDDVDEGRSKKKKEIKKKLKILVPLILLAKAKAVVLVVFFIGVIAASLYKLALLAKIAFIAKIIAIVKALIAAKKHGQIEEEHAWVGEEYGHGHGHGQGWSSGGWSRSRDDGNSLAYSAYKN